MKKLLLFAATLGLAATISQGAGVLPMSTYIDGSTNTISVAGSNVTVNAIWPAATNTFNLPGQANTNLWPAISLPPANNINPLRLICLESQFTASGAHTGNVIHRFHSSADNSHWITNAAWMSITAAGTAQVGQITNLDTYATPYWCLGAIENSNSGSAYITNLVFVGAGKPTN